MYKKGPQVCKRIIDTFILINIHISIYFNLNENFHFDVLLV
jgi:hypothetical protein